MPKKIVILKRRQLLLCTVLVLLAAAILLILTLSGKGNSDERLSLLDARYTPGVYYGDVKLNEYTLQLELAVDRDCIKSVRITNLSEEVLSMYPLIEPSLQAVCEQLIGGVTIDAVTIAEDSKYTQMLLIESIDGLLQKAFLPTED